MSHVSLLTGPTCKGSHPLHTSWISPKKTLRLDLTGQHAVSPLVCVYLRVPCVT